MRAIRRWAWTTASGFLRRPLGHTDGPRAPSAGTVHLIRVCYAPLSLDEPSSHVER